MSEKKEEQLSGDVKERDNIYVVELEGIGFAKEELKVCFNEGYLVVTAESAVCPEQQMRLAFYVGQNVAQENIRASFYNGILKCMLPKVNKRDTKGPTEVEII